MSKSNVKLVLPRMHDKQRNIFVPKKNKFTISCCGTKFGKTLALAIKAAHSLFNADYPIQILWAAPTYPNAKVGYKYLLALLHHDLRNQNASELTITLKHNQAKIFFKGINHDPESVEGEMYHYVIVDEASKMKPQGIVSIRTTTTATKAPIDIVSTPRGKNWFWDYFRRGVDESERDYLSYTYPTSDNPFISRDEIEIARRQLPQRLYEQYYLARFVDESELFVGYHDCIVGEPLNFASKDRQFWYDPKCFNSRVVIGVDWAKTIDYTVFIAIDYERTKPKIVGFMRFQGLKYTDAIKYLAMFASKFKETTTVYHDKTGVGQAIDDMLDSTRLPYEGITFTNKGKSEMVNSYLIAVEQGLIELPNWNEMIEEIECFELTINAIGTMRFEAAKGKHDDIIMAMILAWSATTDYSSQDLEVRSLENMSDVDLSIKSVDETTIMDEISQFEALNSLDGL